MGVGWGTSMLPPCGHRVSRRCLQRILRLLLTGADAGGLPRRPALLALPPQKLADPAPPGPEEGGDDEELQEAQTYIRWGGGWGEKGRGSFGLQGVLPLQRIVLVCPCATLGPAALRMHQAGTLRPIHPSPAHFAQE